MTEVTEPTSDEKLFAALAHFFGMWAALVIWALQRDKSPYVRFQALQSLAYGLLIMVVSFLLGACMFVLIFGGMFASILFVAANPYSDPAGMFPFAMMSFASFALIPLMFLFWIPPIIAAVQTLRGVNFRYPWLGDQVERFLKSEQRVSV